MTTSTETLTISISEQPDTLEVASQLCVGSLVDVTYLRPVPLIPFDQLVAEHGEDLSRIKDHQISSEVTEVMQGEVTAIVTEEVGEVIGKDKSDKPVIARFPRQRVYLQSVVLCTIDAEPKYELIGDRTFYLDDPSYDVKAVPPVIMPPKTEQLALF